MKIIRDNICFVNARDLFGYSLPDYLEFDKDLYEENDFVIFTKDEDIDYVKNREDIIDYDYVSNLSEIELDKKIENIENDLEPYYQHIRLSNEDERIVLFKNKKFANTFFTLDKVYYDLIHYRNNKENIDDKVRSIINDNREKTKSR